MAVAWCWSDFEKMYLFQEQRRSPSKTVGGVKSPFRVKPQTHRDAQKAQTKLVTPGAPTGTETELFECLLRRYGSAVHCYMVRGSGCSRPQYGISPLGGGRHKSTIDPPKFTQDWGYRFLKGTSKTLFTPGPRRKEQ